MATRETKVGQYEYNIRGRAWNVYVCTSVSKDENGRVNGSSWSYVDTFFLKEDARKFVWEKNGWGTPKKALAW